ncbi:NF-kappa-B inhibitor-interacting Ras-like protein 2 isoform X1 [Littorina saxatilis]|uniref:NF-kappa-B inhibitor-interacting Ras-like protein 2 isoform X1 n=1 Tax=Littorina saxatilis TaxID=31220 RepID=UPI0038B55B0C
MGKINKILLCGYCGVGKSAIIEQLLYGSHVLESPSHSTIEDIYTAVIETDRGVKEKVRIFDTGPAALQEGTEGDIPKHYLNFPDGYILVYDTTSWESFRRLEKLKKDIDKHRDKREVHMIVIGNKSELTERRQVQFDTAQAWAAKEKCIPFSPLFMFLFSNYVTGMCPWQTGSLWWIPLSGLRLKSHSHQARPTFCQGERQNPPAVTTWIQAED